MFIIAIALTFSKEADHFLDHVPNTREGDTLGHAQEQGKEVKISNSSIVKFCVSSKVKVSFIHKM